MQKKEAGIIERGDALYHGAVDAIDDGALEAGGGGFLALQFILGAAVPADVVFHRGRWGRQTGWIRRRRWGSTCCGRASLR